MTVTLLTGDSLELLKTLPSDSAHCVVTSPPYFGLRDYATATWEGGDPACDHKVGRFTTPCSAKQRHNAGSGDIQARAICPKCGGQLVDRQLGLEPTPDEYVARMVDVFREVRRVLRADGVLFLNLGDSYANARPGNGGKCQLKGAGRAMTEARYTGIVRDVSSLKPKDLIGIPWRVAFALQADGWWLRSDIIWAKGNPMPESVRDRPTKAHEYIFMLTKSERYFWDAEAVKEPCVTRASWSASDRHTAVAQDGGQGRNIRTVWQINTQPFGGAHFATFPQRLVETCIKAGTSEHGCCSACGAPWERLVQRIARPVVADSEIDRYGNGKTGVHRKVGGQYQNWLDAHPIETMGWRATCDCGEETRPCVMLDPFSGSGTVAFVAERLGRDAIGIDLNPAYNAMARERLNSLSEKPLLAPESAACALPARDPVVG